MSTVNPTTDLVLVQRGTAQHKAKADMSTLQDTDLILVNRGGVDYKCTFLDWKNSQGKAPDVGTVTLSDVAGGDRFTSVAFPVSATMVEDGVPTSSKKLKAYVEGALKSAALSSAITAVGVSPIFNGGLTTTGGVGETPGPTGVRYGYGYLPGGTTTEAECKITYNYTGGAPGDTLIIVCSNYAKNGTGIEILGDAVEAGTTIPNPNPGSVSIIDIRLTFTAATGSITLFLKGTGIPDGGPNQYNFNKAAGTGTPSTVLTLTDSTQLANFAAGDAVTEVGGGDDATGTVGSVDVAKPSITLQGTPANWDVGSQVKGPLKAPAGGASVRLYCVLDAAGNVSDLQSADPGFTAWPPAGASPGPYTGVVSFPATLPTGNPPDTDLPSGTQLTVEVQATNTAGADSAVSNTITPA